MRRRDEELRDPVLFARLHAQLALPAATLRAVGARAGALHVPRVRDGDDHVLFLDQVLLVDLALVGDNLRAALVGVLGPYLLQLHDDDVHQHALVGEDAAEAGDLAAQLAVLGGQLLGLQPGQLREAHLEDGLRLAIRQVVVALLLGVGNLALGAPGAAHERLQPHEREQHELALRLVRVLRLADGLDDQIHLGDGHAEAFDELALRLRLPQLEARAPGDHVAPVLDEDREGLLQVHHLRAPADDGQVDHAEGRLQIRLTVELVDDDLREGVLLQLDHDADGVFAVRLVAHGVAALDDADDLLLGAQLVDLRDDARLVRLVRDGRHHDLFAVFLGAGERLHGHARAHHDGAAAGALGQIDAGAAVDEAARGKIGPGDEAHEVFDRRVRVLDEVDRRVHDLAQVVGRHVGGHADGDAARAVDEQVGHPRRKDRGLLQAVVEVQREVDGLFVDVREQIHRDARQTGLGVTIRGGRIAVDGAVVALAVDERVAHREVLREADHGVVDAGVTVRVVLAEDVTDDGRALAEARRGREACLVGGVENAAVDRLEPVARVGDRATDDHAHRVIEVARPHLVGDGNGHLLVRVRRRGKVVVRHGFRRVGDTQNGPPRLLHTCPRSHPGPT